MTPQMRSTYLYICGSTGTGKSKMLESLVRQDIKNWHKSKCGALVIDPHGSLYNSLINWIAWSAPYLKGVPIVPIDLRQNAGREASMTCRLAFGREVNAPIRNVRAAGLCQRGHRGRRIRVHNLHHAVGVHAPVVTLRRRCVNDRRLPAEIHRQREAARLVVLGRWNVLWNGKIIRKLPSRRPSSRISGCPRPCLPCRQSCPPRSCQTRQSCCERTRPAPPGPA